MDYGFIAPGTVAMAFVPYPNQWDRGGGGIHPIIVVSTGISCERAPSILAVPGTSKMNHTKMPTHYEPDPADCPCMLPTRFRCENLTQIDKSAIRQILGRISKLEYMKLQQCLMQAIHLEKIEW